MIRYEEITDVAKELISKVQEEYFPELKNVKIKFLFDTKKRSHAGDIVLGMCHKTNDLVKHFTINEAYDEDGYQYVIVFDKIAYDNMSDIDRTRLIRHELCHVMIDEEANQPYKIYPHNINDFVEEVRLNTDNPDWARRIASITAEIYAQMKDQEETE